MSRLDILEETANCNQETFVLSADDFRWLVRQARFAANRRETNQLAYFALGDEVEVMPLIDHPASGKRGKIIAFCGSSPDMDISAEGRVYRVPRDACAWCGPPSRIAGIDSDNPAVRILLGIAALAITVAALAAWLR